MTQRARFDSYEHGLPEESFGYYTVEADESEGYHVHFQPYAEAAERSPAAAEDSSETVTANTDQVDREIKQLAQARDALDQQLVQAQRGGDEQAIQELKRRIAVANQELAVKDTDAYRKAHAVYTES